MSQRRKSAFQVKQEKGPDSQSEASSPGGFKDHLDEEKSERKGKSKKRSKSQERKGTSEPEKDNDNGSPRVKKHKKEIGTKNIDEENGTPGRSDGEEKVNEPQSKKSRSSPYSQDRKSPKHHSRSPHSSDHNGDEKTKDRSYRNERQHDRRSHGDHERGRHHDRHHSHHRHHDSRDDNRKEISVSKQIDSDSVFVIDDLCTAYVLLQHPQELFLQGKVQVGTLYGEVDLLGYRVSPGQLHPVFCPCSSIQLSVKTIPSTKENTLESMRSLLKRDLENQILTDIMARVESKGVDSCVVLKLKLLENRACDFITSISSYQELFRKDVARNRGLVNEGLKVVDVEISNGDDVQRCLIPDEYKNVADVFLKAVRKTGSPILVTCGGKNAGKSTLNRYLINRALNKVGSVCFLECDLGQTEFTPPGCIALNQVSKPIFGQPFSHLQEPVSLCYYGALSPGDEPSHYVKCIQYVLQAYHQMEPKPPLIVNTMGWNQGLGIAFMMDVLRSVQPNFVVQIDCRNPSKNYPTLTPEYVHSTPGWVHQDLESESSLSYDHKLIVIKSAAGMPQDKRDVFGAMDYRAMAVLSYLSQLQPGPGGFVRLNALQPYQVPWSAVALHVCQSPVPPAQVLYALNASMVALCNIEKMKVVRSRVEEEPQYLEDLPLCECLGFGFIRGIDPEKKLFYILTPVSVEKLRDVNLLCRGPMDLPAQLFLNQNCPEPLPYVDQSKDVTGASAVRPRRYMQRYRPGPKFLD